MEQQFVYGVYDSVIEAQAAYEKIFNAGIPQSGVQLIAKDEIVENSQHAAIEPVEKSLIDKSGDQIVDRPEPTWLESFTSLFVADGQVDGSLNNRENQIDLSSYQAEIDEGKILLLVNQSYEGDVLRIDRQS